MAGAFDRVDTARFLAKLASKGLPQNFLALFAVRRAFVEINGVASSEYALCNSLFQGTVFGPVLWNTFMEDSGDATSSAGFTDVTYADDLNAFKRFPVTTSNATLLDHCRRCRDNLHAWGAATWVQWEQPKESSHVTA